MVATALRSAEKRGWGSTDDLTNGVYLNKYCPGAIGPSDYDTQPRRHILHSGPWQRIAVIEYKHRDERPTNGQDWLFNSEVGIFTRKQDGLVVTRRFFLIHYSGYEFTSPPEELIFTTGTWKWKVLPLFPTPDSFAIEIVDWLWPGQKEKIMAKNSTGEVAGYPSRYPSEGTRLR